MFCACSFDDFDSCFCELAVDAVGCDELRDLDFADERQQAADLLLGFVRCEASHVHFFAGAIGDVKLRWVVLFVHFIPSIAAAISGDGSPTSELLSADVSRLG